MSTLMGQLQSRIEAAVNKTGTYNEALQNLADAFGVPPSETGSRLIPVVKVFDPTIDNATAAQNYLLYNSTVVAGGIPAMALNFTSSESLDPRITFSRASNATVVNSDGLVSYAPHNLLTNSESFEAAAWTKTTGTTVVANAATAPDATTTADRVVYDGTGTSGSFRIYQGNTISVLNQAYTCSVWMRADAPTTVRLYGNVVAGNYVTCNLTTTWQRFTTSGVGNGVASAQLLIYSPAADNSAISFYIWGAQLNEGPLQPYYFTTPKNLLGYTQEFDNAAWSKSNITVTANSDAAPDGSQTADTLLGTAPGSANSCSQSITAAASVYTFSVWVKAKTASTCGILLRDETAATNLSVTAQIHSGPGSVSGTTVVSVSGLSTTQWTRVALTLNVPVTAGNTLRSILYPETATSANTTGKSNVFWGAQLSNSASVDPYVYNPGAAPTSAAYYGPRFDYDPVTLAPKGLLIEEQRTNLLTYSDGTVANLGPNGNVTDASSAISTSFTNSIQFGDNSVARYAYKSFTTTASATYTLSVYVRMNDDSQPVVSTTSTAGDFGLVFENNLVTIASTVTASGGNVFRITASLTAVGGAGLNFGVIKYTTQTAKGFRVTGYQLEAGAFATSYIPTVASQVTRSADNASMIGDNFSSWYNQSAGTIFAEADVVGVGNSGTANQTSLSISAAATYNDSYVLFIRQSTNNRAVATNLVGITKWYAYVSPVAANTFYKHAFSYESASMNFADSGSIISPSFTDTSLITATRLTLGAYSGGTAFLNGHIRRIMYYNTRLTNSQLQALTS